MVILCIFISIRWELKQIIFGGLICRNNSYLLTGSGLHLLGANVEKEECWAVRERSKDAWACWLSSGQTPHGHHVVRKSQCSSFCSFIQWGPPKADAFFYGGNFFIKFFFLSLFYFFTWLHGAFVSAHGSFSCGVWDLFPWPGIEPRSLALGS